jgi:hypothetical protein
VFINEPLRGYSIDELHAYAKANDFRDEAEALNRYVKLRRRRERWLRLGMLLTVLEPLRSSYRRSGEPRSDPSRLNWRMRVPGRQ